MGMPTQKPIALTAAAHFNDAREICDGPVVLPLSLEGCTASTMVGSGPRRVEANGLITVSNAVIVVVDGYEVEATREQVLSNQSRVGIWASQALEAFFGVRGPTVE